MNRIYFPGNPWPNGHAINELVWSARLEPDSGIWFDLHLESEDYDADDDNAEDDDDEAESDSSWYSKVVWNNYHSCILSSTNWGHSGFLVGTKQSPIDFAAISQRTFACDPLPPSEEVFKRAFGIYLLGHDGAAEHKIHFTPKDRGLFELDWRGKIALEYIGSDTFDHEFHARYNHLSFAGIKLPENTRESDARSLLAPFLVGAEALKPTMKDGSLWMVFG